MGERHLLTIHTHTPSHTHTGRWLPSSSIWYSPYVSWFPRSAGSGLQLTLVAMFHCVQFPGAMLLALSRSRMLRCSATGWTPNDLLDGGAVSVEMKVEARAVVDSCQTLEVPPFTREEMERCLNYFSQKKWISTGQQPLSCSLTAPPPLSRAESCGVERTLAPHVWLPTNSPENMCQSLICNDLHPVKL